ncbi:MAG: hypothetical protein ACTSRG_24845 [Candidatus Helarchaeota archaeon]
MKRCKRCVLPETFPGIRFNERDICNFCLNFEGIENLKKKKRRYKKRFEELVKEYKGRNSYDVLMSYSGGKDSTYTLYILKEKYDLNILAITFDNGFLPKRTFNNIKGVIKKLNIDHILFTPRFEILKKIFVTCSQKNIYSPQTLIRASTICTSCMAIVKFSTLRTAVEKNIHFIAFGWSPGQIPITSSIMKNNPQIIKMMQKNLFGPLNQIVKNKIRSYFLEREHFKYSNDFPYNVSPLAFLDYNEQEIYKKISQLGWKVPDNVDANSTNCLLNSFANIIHKEKYGFHPYVYELAKLVREGYLDRSDALKKLSQPENPETIYVVKRKLGLGDD